MARHLVPLFLLACLVLPGSIADTNDSANLVSAEEGYRVIVVPRHCCWRPLLRARLTIDCCFPPLLPRLFISYRCCQPVVVQPTPSLAAPQPTPATDQEDLNQPLRQPPADPDKTSDPDAPADPAELDLSPPDDSEPVTINVHLPADAILTVNGKSTDSVGSQRQIVAMPTAERSVTLQATVLRNGQRIVQLRQLRITDGDQPPVEFDLLSTGGIATTLTLRVPADARVLIQGQPTLASGQQRIFRTTQLTKGETWPNYRVEVQQQRNGRLVISRRTITLVGGGSHQLIFSESARQVAGQP